MIDNQKLNLWNRKFNDQNPDDLLAVFIPKAVYKGQKPAKLVRNKTPAGTMKIRNRE